MVFKWIILSLAIQALIMAYFNYIYIPGGDKYKVVLHEYKSIPKGGLSVKLPKEAAQINISYDEDYIAYKNEDKLFIMDIWDKKEIGLPEEIAGKEMYYKWLPDRDILIYAYSVSDTDSMRVRVGTLNINSGKVNYYPDIEGLPVKSELAEIKLSPLTNIVYVRIKTGNTSSSIYRYDIMDNLKLVTKADSDIRIEAAYYTDNLIYEYNSKIYIRSGIESSKRELNFIGENHKGKMCLLGIDSEDRIYVGELGSDSKVNKVYYCKVHQSINDEPDIIELEKPVLPENIIITGEGLICINLKEEKTIKLNNKGIELNYEGDLIEFREDYLMTRKNNTLSIKPNYLKVNK